MDKRKSLATKIISFGKIAKDMKLYHSGTLLKKRTASKQDRVRVCLGVCACLCTCHDTSPATTVVVRFLMPTQMPQRIKDSSTAGDMSEQQENK